MMGGRTVLTEADTRSALPALQKYARKLTRSVVDAEDLMQDTLVRAWAMLCSPLARTAWRPCGPGGGTAIAISSSRCISSQYQARRPGRPMVRSGTRLTKDRASATSRGMPNKAPRTLNPPS